MSRKLHPPRILAGHMVAAQMQRRHRKYRHRDDRQHSPAFHLAACEYEQGNQQKPKSSRQADQRRLRRSCPGCDGGVHIHDRRNSAHRIRDRCEHQVLDACHFGRTQCGMHNDGRKKAQRAESRRQQHRRRLPETQVHHSIAAKRSGIPCETEQPGQ